MSNTIAIDGGITLVLSDDAMNALFGGLLVSQVNNMQKHIDILAMTVARLEAQIADNDTSIETIEGNVSNMEDQLNTLDSRIDGLPDFDSLDSRLDDMESTINADSIDEMEGRLDEVEVIASKCSHDIDVANLIFRAIGDAVNSQVKV